MVQLPTIPSQKPSRHVTYHVSPVLLQTTTASSPLRCRVAPSGGSKFPHPNTAQTPIPAPNDGQFCRCSINVQSQQLQDVSNRWSAEENYWKNFCLVKSSNLPTIKRVLFLPLPFLPSFPDSSTFCCPIKFFYSTFCPT